MFINYLKYHDKYIYENNYLIILIKLMIYHKTMKKMISNRIH